MEGQPSDPLTKTGARQTLRDFYPINQPSWPLVTHLLRCGHLSWQHLLWRHCPWGDGARRHARWWHHAWGWHVRGLPWHVVHHTGSLVHGGHALRRKQEMRGDSHYASLLNLSLWDPSKKHRDPHFLQLPFKSQHEAPKDP